MAQSHVQLILDASQPTRQLKKIDAQSKQFANTIKKTNGALSTTGARAKGAAVGTAALGKSAKGAAISFKALGASIKSAFLPLLGITAVIGGVTKAFGVIVEQDKANAALRTLGVDADALAPKLLAVSKELNHQASQTELTVAAYDVASAGFTEAADAAMVLKASALAAGAGMADLSTTGDAVTTVLNAWKMSASEAETVADKMQQTVADGKIKIGEYAANIGKVATTAAQLKVPLSEVNAAISLATKSGVSAERAFTGVNAALAQIAGGQAGKTLGIEMDATTIQAEGLRATLQKIAEMPVGLQIKALGREGHAAMGPILNDLKQYDQLLRNQENSAGVAAKAQAQQAQTIAGAWKELTTVISNLFSSQSELGDALKVLIQATTVGIKLIAWMLKPVFKMVSDIAWLVNKIVSSIKWLWDSAGGLMQKAVGGNAPGVMPLSNVQTEDVANASVPKKSVAETNAALTKTKTLVEQVNALWKDVGLTIGENITGAIKGLIKGTQSLGQALNNILGSIADKLLDAGINMLLGAIFPGGSAIGKFLFGRAAGGPVQRGQPYRVGERGPEMFVPSGSGRIIPNNGIGGGTTINVTVNTSGANVEGEGQGAELGKMLANAIQQQLVREQMPGGLLA